MVERQPPGDADQPRPEALAVAQPAEIPISPHQSFLGDVLGIFAIVEHPQRHAEGEPGRLLQPPDEFALQRVVRGHCRFRTVAEECFHCRSTMQDAARGVLVQSRSHCGHVRAGGPHS